VNDRESEVAAKRFADLYAAGAFPFPAGLTVAMGDVLPIVDEQGGLAAWLAPFVVGDRLLAMALLTPDRILQRFSLLAGGRLDAAPAAANWLDPTRVRERVVAVAGRGAKLDTPVFSFDGDLSRLAWRVGVELADGSRRHWFVAGSSIWPAAEAPETSYRGTGQ